MSCILNRQIDKNMIDFSHRAVISQGFLVTSLCMRGKKMKSSLYFLEETKPRVSTLFQRM